MDGRVALCADDFVNGIGGIPANVSNDFWQSAEYVSILWNNYKDAPNGTETATFETCSSIHAVIAYLPAADGKVVETSNFLIVDITSDIEEIVGPYLA